MWKFRWRLALGYRGACVRLLQLGLLASGAPAANLALQVSSETVPAGGWAQIKISAAAPALVASGRVVMNFDPTVFGPIASVAVFGATGDAAGVATVNGESLDVNFDSQSAGIGQLPDLPVLTVTLPVLASAAAGTVSAITIDPSQSPWTDQNGNAYTVTATPGSVTVGGSLSVQNLSPGGGLEAAGTVVQINGTGFGIPTTVNIAGVSLSNTQFVSPTQIDVTLGGAADLTGKQVTLTNSDGSQAEFISSISSVPEQTPVALAAYQPLPSMQTWTGAVTYVPQEGGGIALQNPNPVPVNVVLQTLNQIGSIALQTTVTVPPGALQVYSTYSTNSTGVVEGIGFNAFASLPVRMMGIGLQLVSSVGPIIAIPEGLLPTVPAVQKVTPEPTAVSFNWQVGTAIPAPVGIILGYSAAAPGSNLTYAVTLSGAPFSYTTSPATAPGITVAVNPVGLSPGNYTGSIIVTPEGPNAVVTTIPLSLTVSAAALLNASPTSLTFADYNITGGTLSIASNGNPIAFTVIASNGAGPNWLSVSPSSGTTPAQLLVSTNSSALANGVYSGQIVISGPNNSLTVPVQLTVNTAELLTFSPSSVTFSVQVGSATPPAQIVEVSPTTGAVYSGSTNSGGNWLSVSTASSGYDAVVTANPAGLAVGTYTGAVTATSPASPVPVSIPVILVIWSQQPVLSVAPSSVTFTIPVPTLPGGQEPVQTLQVTSGGIPLNFGVGGAETLATPASISVSPPVPTPVEQQINQSKPLANLSPGALESNLSITSGSQTVVVPVTTFITTGPATPPFLGSIVNAASQIPASVAPGEILTIFGFGAGPSNVAGFTLNASGSVATSLNGAQVLFDGNPAPMIYGSAYQANVIVPYAVAGQATTTIELQFGGVTSGAWTVPVAASAPGVFNIGGTGLGQAAVLNQDSSVNSASNPAARGSVVQIYATGEGQTSPLGVTGSVIETNLKRPVLSVTVSIGGQNAAVQYAGSAGNSVAGLLQVNALVPQDVTPGAAVPIVVSVGGVPSQSGVTIAVQ